MFFVSWMIVCSKTSFLSYFNQENFIDRILIQLSKNFVLAFIFYHRNVMQIGTLKINRDTLFIMDVFPIDG